jgi:hypothetical protein
MGLSQTIHFLYAFRKIQGLGLLFVNIFTKEIYHPNNDILYFQNIPTET